MLARLPPWHTTAQPVLGLKPSPCITSTKRSCCETRKYELLKRLK